MNISKEDKNKILDKYNNLNNIKKILKSEFVGLDDVIDDICMLVEPWYIFPNAQIRPTVINLWGMTGTGKTSLVMRLLELLKISSILKIDVGEWVDKNDFELTTKISSQFIKLNKDSLIPVLIFDEFQLGRTKLDDGLEVDRPALRVIWDILDTGKILMTENKWEISNLYKIYSKLYNLHYYKGVDVKNGVVVKNKDEWRNAFSSSEDDYDSSVSDSYKSFYPIDAFIPACYLWNIKILNKDFFSEKEIATHLIKLNAKEILEFIEETIEKSMTPVEYDFTNSIIFIIGNIDEVFYESDKMSPDIDADSLYEHTSKITISNVKEALTLRYRPEQISRLGNNHIIYKSFNETMYKDIISLELNKINEKVKSKFNIEIEFDKTINEILYKEGVFPTQGVRPILSTINVLIESYIGKIIVDSIKLKIDVKKIYWKFENDEHVLLLNGKKIIKYPVKLKVESVRKSKNDDEQSLVAVHEAGHIVTSVYALNIIPKTSVSRTANGNGGFTHIETPEWESKDFLLNNIICLIGGYCAEKIIFGESNITSGSYKDLVETTNIALKLLKEYGMNGLPLRFSTPDFRVSSGAICLEGDQMDRMAMEIVKDCMDKCENILNENMELLLRLSEHLSKNSKINHDEILNMVEKYGKYMPKIKTKHNYYEYKNILNEKIKKYIKN